MGEKQKWFLPKAHVDVDSSVISREFGKFSIPTKAEGFDELRFEWQDESGSKEYLQKWVLDRKLHARMEDLKPGEWFRKTSAAWKKSFGDFQQKHREAAK